MGKTQFFKWLIIFCLVCIGLMLAYLTGLIDKVNRADITKLSFVMAGLFLYYSAMVGFSLWRDGDASKICRECVFVSNAFLSLGMIGTVIGFIYMLSISFGSLGVADATNLKLALQTMGIGMGTALYTTAIGLICNLLLRLQLYLFAAGAECGE